MNDEQYTPSLGTWLKDTDVTPPDPQARARQIMTGLPEREKRRTWWPFHRQTTSGARPTTDQTTQFQAPPVPASNGHTPTVTGRTQSMFSPAKAIAAGALIFAIGGVLLIAQPFDQQAGSVPGAATDAEFAAPVEVTGRFAPTFRSFETLSEGGDGTVLPGAWEFWSYPGTVTASDSRLSGSYIRVNNDQWIVNNGLESSEALLAACSTDPECDVTEGISVGFQQSATSIENDEGTWRMRPQFGADMFTDLIFDEEGEPFIEVYDGEDAYEGLVAVLELTDRGGPVPFVGFILDARVLPEPPENASTK